MEKTEKKKQIIKIIVPVIAMLIVLGISYAYWQITSTQTDGNILATGCFATSFTEDNTGIELTNAFPVTDEEGMEGEAYTFTIQNTCDLYAGYQINLEVLNSSTLLAQYVKAGLNAEVLGIVTSNDEVATTIGNASKAYELKTGGLAAGESITYNLRIWMDEDTTIEQGSDKTFSSKITVITSPKKNETYFADVLLKAAGGVAAIKAKPIPKFARTSPYLLTYDDPNPWRYPGTTSISQSIWIGTEYIYDEELGTYTLGGIVTQGITPDNAREGQYTLNSTNKTDAGSSIYKIGTYVSGTVGNTITVNQTRKNVYVSETYSNDAGMYTTSDDYGDSYYFRGAVDNNWVEFAGYYWRIIRIDGKGDIRMIYQGVADGSPEATGEGTDMIAAQTFSHNGLMDDNAYVGFKHGAAGQGTYALTHTQNNPSNAYTQITNWYNTNLASQGSSVTSKIVQNAVYCGDRTAYTNVTTMTLGNGYGTQTTSYGAGIRLGTNKTPMLTCQNPMSSGVPVNNDQYTIPMGLITADEVSFAGGKVSENNYLYWLYTGRPYWTMSPSNFIFNVRMYTVDNRGGLFASEVLGLQMHGEGHLPVNLRGVIALKSNVKYVSGDGTMGNPYVIS